ncbi:MAG: HTTM domain-containing protein [Chloroflexi bacterium]|nr:HTTM domain-containing protein [Chloroflexota bacterium]
MKANPTGWLKVVRETASTQVDGGSIVAFRVIFGLIGVLVVARFLAHGWIGPLYVEPDHHFTYLGFGWVRPWPGWGMYAHFAALGLLSLSIAAGYRPRLFAALFCIGFTYVELIDRTTYLNHYYLMSLVSLVLAILPSSRDAAPLWTIWVLRAQIGIVYVFAGMAKLNADWLFHALPMRIWLYQHGDLPLLGPMLQETWVAYALSWGGTMFDLAIVPLLLWRRARPFAYAMLVTFHLATWALFPQLGVFPWLMIGLSLVFFDPDWPRRLLRFLPRRRVAPITQADAGRWQIRATLVALALFAAVQLALPLRHFAYPGNVRWNEEGYRFAWRVMLSEKVGFVRYRVRDLATDQSWLVDPGDYLTPLQVERMSFQPDMIQQTARMIAADFAERGYGDVVVNADAFVAFNGRTNARLIDPDADLASVSPGLAPKTWVLPYEPDVATAGNNPDAGQP